MLMIFNKLARCMKTKKAQPIQIEPFKALIFTFNVSQLIFQLSYCHYTQL
jgi:hypothetical protein